MARSPYRNSERFSNWRSSGADLSPSDRNRRGERSPVRVEQRRRSMRGDGATSRASQSVSSGGLGHARQFNKTPTQKRKPHEETECPDRPRKMKYDSTANVTDDEDELSSLKTKLKGLQADIKEKDHELIRLKKKADLKKKTLEKTEDLEVRNKVLLKEILFLKRELKGLREEIDDVEAPKKDAKEGSKLDDAKDMKRIRKERDDALLEKGKAVKMKDEAIDSLEAGRKEIETLKKSLTRVRGERDSFKNYTGSLGELETELEAIKLDKDEALKDLENKSKEWKVKEVQLNNLISKLAVEDPIVNKNDSDGNDGEFIPDSQHSAAIIEDSDIVIHSDDEFPDEESELREFSIKNYKAPKYCASNGIKTPDKFINDVFKPVVCSLNNQVQFISTGGYKGTHKPKFNTPARCMLFPVCDVKWIDGDYFGRVVILESPNHPKDGSEVWVCYHHNAASIAGNKLQVQTRRKELKMNDLVGNGDDTTEDAEDDGLNGIKALESPLIKRSRKTPTKKESKSTHDLGDSLHAGSLTTPRGSQSSGRKSTTRTTSREASKK